MESARELNTLIFFIIINNKEIHFAKLYDHLKFFQIWQPTAVRHGGRRDPQR
jgi:hypothetical protein